MILLLKQDGSTLRITIEGVVDEEAANQLKKCFSGIDLSGIGKVIFDFRDLAYIGSSGVGKLLLFYKQSAEKNIEISAENLPPSVYELFMQLHLDALFKLEQKAP